MKDKDKTKGQLLIELNDLRNQLVRNEQSNSEKSGINNKNNGIDFNLYESHYSTLVERVPFGIQDTDVFGNILFGNTAYHKLYGYPVGELIGKSIFDLVSTEEEKETLRNYLFFLVNEQPPPTLYQGKRTTKNGDIIDVEIAWNYRYDGEKKVVGFISILTDITKRKMKEIDSQREKEYLDSVFLNMPAGLAILEGPEFRYHRLNQELADINGILLEEHIGRPLAEVLPLAVNEILPELQKVIDTGESTPSREFSTRLQKDPDKIRHFIDRFYPIKDQDGKVKAVGVIVIDIGKRKRAEESLKRSYDKLEKLVEERTKSLKKTLKVMQQEMVDRKLAEKELIKSKNIIEDQSKMLIEAQRLANLGSWNWDMENNKVTVSKEANRIVGIDKESLFQSAGSYMKLIHPDDYEYVRQAMLDLIETGGNAEFQYRIIRPDGIERVLRACSTIEYNVDGNPSRMIGAVLDITESNEATKKIKQTKEKLRALASRIENIREEERIYISREIHDDLGHSLTALLIDLHSLGTRRGFQNKELANELKPMISLVNHSIETIRKIASNLRPGVLDKLGLGAALEWELEEFKKRNKMICIANIEEEITEGLNMEKTTALFRIFQEILTNISRHANATKMTVVLKSENKKIKLFVSDNGRGITKENLDNMNSLGILGMQERTKIIGGEFSISGSKQMGTEVNVIIPIE